MPSLADSAWHLLCFAVIVMGPAWCAAMLARHAWPDGNAAVRAVVATIGAVAWLLLTARALSALHLFARGPMLVASLLPLVIGWRAAHRRPPGTVPYVVGTLAFAPRASAAPSAPASGAPRAIAPTARQRLFGTRVVPLRPLLPNSPTLRLVLLAVLLVVFVVLARALVMPPASWDGLTYHLALAGHWIQQQAMVPLFAPDAMDTYSHLPENGEILAACFMLPFHADTLVGLAGFPFLLLVGLALWALATELELAPEHRLLLALAICTSPMLLAYVTTSYVDLQVAAEVLCGVLFCFRTLRNGRVRDALAMFVCFGLAVGTKPTALPLAALACGIVWVRELWRGRRLAILAAAPALLLLLGAERYVRNAIETGNPLYPSSLSLLGQPLFAASGYVQRANAEIGSGTLRHDLSNLLALVRYLPVEAPRTAGPKFLLLGGLGLWFLAQLTRGRRDPDWRRHLLLACFWVLPLAAFYLDRGASTMAVRRFWAHDTPRFLAAPLALMALAGLLALRERPRLRRLATFVLAGAILLDLLVR